MRALSLNVRLLLPGMLILALILSLWSVMAEPRPVEARMDSSNADNARAVSPAGESPAPGVSVPTGTELLYFPLNFGNDPQPTSCPEGQFLAQYYSNSVDLEGSLLVTQCETGIDYEWPGSPVDGVSADNFSVRWTGNIRFEADAYVFNVVTDDGMRVWIDGLLILDEWRDQDASEFTSAAIPLSAGLHELRVEYYNRVGRGVAKVGWSVLTCPTEQFRAEYFSNNISLSGTPAVVRCEPSVNYRWGDGSPAPGVSADNFSVRWVGQITLPNDLFLFTARTDDGMRVWIDGVLIIDEWRHQTESVFTAGPLFVAGGVHEIRIEYYDNVGIAVAQVSWARSNCPAGLFRAEYYPNRTLSGEAALIRCETSVDNRWGTASPVPNIPPDNFSVRWSGRFQFSNNVYFFRAVTDDGMRAWLDDDLLIDEWRDQTETTYQTTRAVTQGEHEVRIEYYEGAGEAVAQFSWGLAGCPVGQYLAEYFNNESLTGASTFARCENSIAQDWNEGGPGNGVGNDHFSVRWTGRIYFAGGNVTFVATTDDGMRIWLDNDLILDEWRVQAESTYRVTRNVAEGDHTVRVEYFESSGAAKADVRLEAVCGTGQWRADYYSNRDLAGNPTFSRCESVLDHDWGTGGPGHGIGNDDFSVRWSGRFHFEGGNYSFFARMDDGMRAWIDNALILDEWGPHSGETFEVFRAVSAGEHDVRVEYFEATFGALAEFNWVRRCQTGQFFAQYFNNTTLTDPVVMSRCEGAINHDWGTGGPGGGVNNDNFSARWVGRFSFSGGTYNFDATTDDGIRIWFDGVLIMDEWRIQAAQTFRETRFVPAGEHEVRVEYFEATQNAVAKVSWTQTR